MPSDVTVRRLLRAASLVHKLRRRRYEATATKRTIAARRAQFYRDVWREAAESVGGELTTLGGAALELRCGPVTLRTQASVTSLDDPLTIAVAEDKVLVYRLLAQRNLPVPRHTVCAATDLRAAWAFARSLRRPCVVKPARDTSGAIGVATGVATRGQMAAALVRGGAFCDDLIVEEQVRGDVYRLLYMDGELLDAVLRRPPTVRGDGTSTVAALVAAENRRRLEGGIEASQSLLKTDSEMRRTLRRQGSSLRSVPRAGQTVVLSGIVNDNRRDDNVSAAGRLCRDVVAAGAEAAAAVGARLAGVDLITPDPSVPLSRAGGVVIEVNTTPGYYYHYMKADGRTPVATMILQRLLREAT